MQIVYVTGKGPASERVCTYAVTAVFGFVCFRFFEFFRGVFFEPKNTPWKIASVFVVDDVAGNEPLRISRAINHGQTCVHTMQPLSSFPSSSRPTQIKNNAPCVCGRAYAAHRETNPNYSFEYAHDMYFRACTVSAPTLLSNGSASLSVQTPSSCLAARILCTRAHTHTEPSRIRVVFRRPVRFLV